MKKDRRNREGVLYIWDIGQSAHGAKLYKLGYTTQNHTKYLKSNRRVNPKLAAAFFRLVPNARGHESYLKRKYAHRQFDGSGHTEIFAFTGDDLYEIVDYIVDVVRADLKKQVFVIGKLHGAYPEEYAGDISNMDWHLPWEGQNDAIHKMLLWRQYCRRRIENTHENLLTTRRDATVAARAIGVALDSNSDTSP